jgi:hypothetical protein
LIVYQQDAAGWKKIYENEASVREIDIADDGSAWFYTWEALYSWDGHSWNRLSSFDDIVGSRERVTAFHAHDSEHVWIVSETSEQKQPGDDDEWYEISKIYFYDGKTWSMQFEVEGDAGIFILDPDHAWCWSDKDIYYYNGESWKEQFSSEYTIRFIEASNPECAWAIGYAVGLDKMNWSMAYCFDGSQWKEKGEIEQMIDSLAIIDNHSAWAWLANPGGLYHEGKPLYSDIFKWNGDTWERSLDEDQDLVSVIILGPDLAWAAFHDKAYVYQDNHWSLKLEDKAIVLLEAADEQNAWCIVEDGSSVGNIIAFDGISWNRVCDIEENCSDMLAFDPSHVWVTSHPGDEINESGYLIRSPNTSVYFFNGANWTKQFDTDARIIGLEAKDFRQIWAYSNSMVFTADKE